VTQPNPDEQGGKAGKAPAARVLDVVEYTHRDLITGHEVTAVGVVVRAEKDDRTVAVRPLAHHHLEVDPANVTPLSATDVG
jgi:hypothetical protein